jgi:hypothetical protein
MSRAQLKPGIQAPGFEFTAHLSWSGFDDVDSEDVAFTDWTPDGPLTEVLAAERETFDAVATTVLPPPPQVSGHAQDHLRAAAIRTGTRADRHTAHRG